MESRIEKSKLWNLWYAWTHSMEYTPDEKGIRVPWCDKNESYDEFERLYLEWKMVQDKIMIINDIGTLSQAICLVEIIHNNIDVYYIGEGNQNKYYITKSPIDNPVKTIYPNPLLNRDVLIVNL